VTIFLAALAVSFVGVSAWRLHDSSERGNTPARHPEVAMKEGPPEAPFPDGEYLIAFVFLSSDCGWSSLPNMIKAVGNLRETLHDSHEVSFAKIQVVGVALDNDLEAGLGFLAELGSGELGRTFDQIAVGGSWLNEEVVRFVWQDEMAEAALPQIVVIERSVDTRSYLTARTIGVHNDRILVNPIGNAEITEWLRAEAPLDWTPYHRNTDPIPDLPG
jgi:hypothetical protein